MWEKWKLLPPFKGNSDFPPSDWILMPFPVSAEVYQGNSESEIVLSNGLISRTFRTSPNGATVGFDNLMTGESLIRGIKPEALVTLDGQVFPIGGLVGQVEYAYLLPEWIGGLEADLNAFHLEDFEVCPIEERFPWLRKRYSANLPWPPKGTGVVFHYTSAGLPSVGIVIHYEIYDGIPLLAKWLTIINEGETPLRLNTFTVEVLAMVEYESLVENPGPAWTKPNIHVESDYEFLGMSPKTADKTTFWVPDPQYSSQVCYDCKAPYQLETRPPIGPEVDIQPGETFESFRTYELVHDSTDRERKGLAVRRMYRTLAPWVTENPIMMHVINADPEVVKVAIDQCVEVGFEMVILSFGSGFNMEYDDPEFFEEYKELFDYAHANGIEIGGYSLFSGQSISPAADVIDPETGKPSTRTAFGHSPCLGSAWGIEYLQKLSTCMEALNMDVLENDGPYAGDVCASTTHPGHRDLYDSQWTQWRQMTDFYKACRANGIFINAPDWYYLSGTNKNAMGYKEVNWSLPRERQVIIGRQNIYDGTWEKTPSMGWMFTPLTVYHTVGNWEQSTLEPLADHLALYEAHLAQNFGSGVQSCYRGLRLYDTEETKAVVQKWVTFYHQYRAILDSDIVHVRRPDGRHIDCILHVNPQLEIKGLAMVYNPLSMPVEETVRLPLYYTGLTETASISVEGGDTQIAALDRQYNIRVPLVIAPRSSTWLLIQ